MRIILHIVIFLLVQILVILFSMDNWPIEIQMQTINKVSDEKSQIYIKACVKELYKCQTNR
jgi:hypothetical protein